MFFNHIWRAGGIHGKPLLTAALAFGLYYLDGSIERYQDTYGVDIPIICVKSSVVWNTD